jgi:hypothetical protein
MTVFACHNGQNFILTVLADSKEEAQNMTNLYAVESIDNVPWIGWKMYGKEYRPPRPFDSWIWDGTNWQAPKDRPVDILTFWNEANKEWEPVVSEKPFPSWILNVDGSWIAPKPYPEDSILISDDEVTININSGRFSWNEDLLDWELNAR